MHKQLKRWLAWTVKVLSLSFFGKNVYFRAPLKKAELRRVTSMLKYWNYIIQIMKRPAILAMCSAQESSGLGQKKLKCFLNISLAPSTVQHTTQHLSLLVVDMKISDRIMGKLENVNDWWVMSPIVGQKKMLKFVLGQSFSLMATQTSLTWQKKYQLHFMRYTRGHS